VRGSTTRILARETAALSRCIPLAMARKPASSLSAPMGRLPLSPNPIDPCILSYAAAKPKGACLPLGTQPPPARQGSVPAPPTPLPHDDFIETNPARIGFRHRLGAWTRSGAISPPAPEPCSNRLAAAPPVRGAFLLPRHPHDHFMETPCARDPGPIDFLSSCPSLDPYPPARVASHPLEPRPTGRQSGMRHRLARSVMTTRLGMRQHLMSCAEEGCP
jgi:hypothetical protein